LPAFRLTGHPDVASVTPERLVVLDWKTGRDTSAAPLPQLLGYAYCLGRMANISPQVSLKIAWLREGNMQEWDFAWLEVVEYIRGLHSDVRNWDGKSYEAGAHCRYCPRSHQCPAQKALAQSAMTTLADTSVLGVARADIAPALPDLYARVQMLERHIKAFRKWLRDDVEANGPIVCGDKTLAMGERRISSIDPQRAWAVLQEHLSEEELARCLKVAKGEMLAVIASKATTGDKGTAKARLMKQLEDADAISVSVRTALEWIETPVVGEATQ